MAWIGFIALVLLGGYCAFAGVAILMLSIGLAGKPEKTAFVWLLAGVAMMYAAWVHKPFTVLISL